MNSETKLKWLIFSLLIMSPASYALQDVNLTMRNTKGLCFYLQDVNFQYCNNETMILNGSIDHMIHLSSQKPYAHQNNYTTNSTQMITDYINLDFAWELSLIGVMSAIFIFWLRGKQ